MTWPCPLPPSLTWLWLWLRLLIQRRCVHCRWGRGYVFGGRVRRRVRELRQKIWLEGALRLGLWRRGLELAHAKITHLNISFISFVRDSGTRVYIYIQLLHLAYSAFFFFFYLKEEIAPSSVHLEGIDDGNDVEVTTLETVTSEVPISL